MKTRLCQCCGQPLPEELSVDLDSNLVSRSGNRVYLTPAAAVIAHILFKRAPMAAAREQIMCAVWGSGDCPDTVEATLNTHMHRLRKDLAPLGVAIKTIYGFGYQLELKDLSSLEKTASLHGTGHSAAARPAPEHAS